MIYTPIVSALQELADKEKQALHMPGHKQGLTPGLLSDWLGTTLQYDQTEVGILDSLHAPNGPIRQSEQLVADLYGAKATYFTTNGSSAGLIASLLAATDTGAEVIVPRNMHKAVLAGIVLADLWPHFVEPVYQDGYELGITPASLQAALIAHPEAQAVLLLHPTYEGVTCDLEQLVSIAKAANCRVIIDEAHGAHFSFHPSLPTSAVRSQADWVVQSAHKTLPALTGAAWVHRLSDDHADEYFRSRLNLVQSTSPSWLLLGSLDLAQQELRLHGRSWLENAIAKAHELATAIEQNTPLIRWLPPATGSYQQDPLKINLLTAASGQTGYAVARYLEDHGYYIEMAKPHAVLLMLTMADAAMSIDPLVECLARLPRATGNDIQFPPAPPQPQLCLRPRQAYLSQTCTVERKQAQGRIAARPVYAYPPGVPLVYPGELLEQDILDYVDELTARGGYLTGLQQGAWVVVAAT